jgi:hypothetical protein
MIPNLSKDWLQKLRDRKKKMNIPCMTTSTAGFSFNSPPVTDRAFEEGGHEYDV